MMRHFMTTWVLLGLCMKPIRRCFLQVFGPQLGDAWHEATAAAWLRQSDFKGAANKSQTCLTPDHFCLVNPARWFYYDPLRSLASAN